VKTDDLKRKAERMKSDSTFAMTYEPRVSFDLIDFLSTLAIKIWLHNPQVKMDRIALQIEVTTIGSFVGRNQNKAQ
jgi:hypothetical protein